MHILSPDQFKKYSLLLKVDIKKIIETKVSKAVYSKSDFEYYVQCSAAYSSNIEGNSIDIDTYLKNKKFKIKSKPKEMAEIDDLVLAYNYAINHRLEEKFFLESHKILSQNILSLKSQRGKLRNQQVGIFSSGKIEYMAVEPQFVQVEFSKLFADIRYLCGIPLTQEEIFYYASMIHLLFEKIHPFMDGNGRAGRLLEKWFLSAKIGEKAWAINSEKYYSINRAAYYQNIHIGFDYYNLQIKKCLPFLLMLPQSLSFEK